MLSSIHETFNRNLTIILQGLGDTDGRDTQHIASMVRELKELDYVNAFLVVFNSQNPRMDEHLRAMLDIFARYLFQLLLLFL